MSALTMFATHGDAGAHLSEVIRRLSNLGGGAAPFSQWADLPLADVPYLLLAFAAIVLLWRGLGRIGSAAQPAAATRATARSRRRVRLALIAVLGIMIMLGLAAL